MAAALGGAIVPALVFVLININNSAGIQGYGIPMATDIAFLLVIITFIDSRVPNALRVFFSALAIVDDILAILVISVFYTENLKINFLIGALIVLVILVGMNRGRIYQKLPYIVLGIVMWWFILQSGVHATVAGVLLAMTIPARKAPDTKALIAQCSNLMNDVGLPEADVEDLRHSAVQTLESITQRIQSPLEALEHDIQPWVTYAILPIFALANAGIVLAGTTLSSLGNSVTIGIIFGLVLGKPIGILGFAWIAVKLGWADLPSQVSWKSMFSISWLAGIGFTMSLFISNLAYSDQNIIADAKIGILIASTLATIIGLSCGYFMNDEIGSSKSKVSSTAH